MGLLDTLIKDGLLSALVKIEESKDTLTIGTPGKGGEISIRVDANDYDGAVRKLENMVKLRDAAQEMIGYDPNVPAKRERAEKED